MFCTQVCRLEGLLFCNRTELELTLREEYRSLLSRVGPSTDNEKVVSMCPQSKFDLGPYGTNITPTLHETHLESYRLSRKQNAAWYDVSL
jgi:hypothetical protein